MKKLFLTLLILTFFISYISRPSFAASGKAIIPPGDFRHITSSAYYEQIYFVANITSSPIIVKITIYNQSGSMIRTGFTSFSSNLTNFIVNPGDSSVSFTLSANATGAVLYTPTTIGFGYGIIQWSQNSSELFGLIADVKEGLTTSLGYAFRTLLVNSSMPFWFYKINFLITEMQIVHYLRVKSSQDKNF